MAVLSLPYELRTRIYEALFLGCVLTWKTVEDISEATGHADCPAILYVSKQINAECRAVMLKTARIDLSYINSHQVEVLRAGVLDLSSVRHLGYNRIKSQWGLRHLAAVVKELPNLVSLTYHTGERPCIAMRKSGGVAAGMTNQDFQYLQKSRLMILGGARDAGTRSGVVKKAEMEPTVWELIRAWKRRSCSFKLQAELRIFARDYYARPSQPHVLYAVSLPQHCVIADRELTSSPRTDTSTLRPRC